MGRFGGTVYKRKRRVKPDAFEWRIFGHEAVAAARELAMVAWTKREQLLEVISFPLGTKRRGGTSKKQLLFSSSVQTERLQIHDKVKLLKKQDSAMNFMVTEREFAAMLAGFLDSDGSVPKKGIVFSQKHQNILKEILRRFPGGKLTDVYTTLKGKKYGPYGHLYYGKSAGKEMASQIVEFVVLDYKRDALINVYGL